MVDEDSIGLNLDRWGLDAIQPRWTRTASDMIWTIGNGPSLDIDGLGRVFDRFQPLQRYLTSRGRRVTIVDQL